MGVNVLLIKEGQTRIGDMVELLVRGRTTITMILMCLRINNNYLAMLVK